MSLSQRTGMRVGIVGCGYVADFYARTLANHPQLIPHSVFDQRTDRAAKLAAWLGVKAASSLSDFLNDPALDLVVNLTPPDTHATITRSCLEAGKNVYSEKPLATDLETARSLVRLASALGLKLACAPCTVLGEPAQTLWREIRSGSIGVPRLVYAEMDDGAVHKMAYKYWINAHGVPWPAESEFATGCILEHAAYPLSWLITFFGPVQEVVASSHTLVPDKGFPLKSLPHDFSVAVLKFEAGVVARLTCGVVGSRNRGVTVFGDDGILSIDDCWTFDAPVVLTRTRHARARGRADSSLYLDKPTIVSPAKGPVFTHHCGDKNDVDYARGVAELAASVVFGRACRLDARIGLHVLEVQEAMQQSCTVSLGKGSGSPFERPLPLEWAM